MNMVQNTTRLCPRNTTNITTNRKYQMYDRMIQYQILKTVMFGGTMHAWDIAGESVRK